MLVYIVSDAPIAAESLAMCLRYSDYRVRVYYSVSDALAAMNDEVCAVVSNMLREGPAELHLARCLAEREPSAPLFVVSNFNRKCSALEEAGAAAILEGPCDPAVLMKLIEDACPLR